MPEARDQPFHVVELVVAHGDRVLVENLDLTVARGESASISGYSGSGKSTLLMAFAGLVASKAGRISGLGHPGRGASSRRLAAWRLRELGIVYQFGELMPELDPLDNVALPALLAGTARKKAYDRARHLLDRVAAPHDTPTPFLSGGERQRVAIARALVNQPSLIVADEPTGSLDPATADEIANLLFDYAYDMDCALITVTHSPQFAALADRRYRLTDGRLVAW